SSKWALQNASQNAPNLSPSVTLNVKRTWLHSITTCCYLRIGNTVALGYSANTTLKLIGLNHSGETMSQKQYDIVVCAATSYVSQLLVHYLCETYDVKRDVRWALAGRNSAKLTSLKQQLGSGAHKLPALIADANDANSLQAMAASTRVVASTVGPYALYGSPTVAACVNAATDYCDLTGEVQWIIDMVSTYESKAKETGARIVHCCGFDSIPSDMGVFHLQQQAQSAFGQAATQVKMRVKSAKGGVSGGTVASIINLAKEIGENPSLRQTLSNHYAICPEGY